MLVKLIQFCVMISTVFAKMDSVCKMDAPLGLDPETCCKVPDLLEHATLEKCAISVFKNDSADVSSEIINKLSGQCLFECIFKEHGIFRNNEVLTDEAVALIKQGIDSDPEWMPIVSNAVNTCKEMAAALPTATMKPGTCSSLPAFYFGCFHTQLFKNCPDTKWTSNAGCNQLKQNAEKCPILTAVVSMD